MIKDGRIIKIIGDLYTVYSGKERFDCKARGKFRNDKMTPLVGDQILFDMEKKYILELKSRKNSLKRPPVCNLDCAIVVTSLKKPDISWLLLDKLLCSIIINNIKPIIVITKADLVSKKELKIINKRLRCYKKLGIPVIFNNKIAKLKKIIKNKYVVLAGQTGAGKSSLLNKLDKDLNLKTGEISLALNRGKHTTRHVEFYQVGKSFIADTPGFSALDLDEYSEEEICRSFIEFKKYQCKYNNCNHLSPIDCGVAEAYADGKILSTRYENYKKIINKGDKK